MNPDGSCSSRNRRLWELLPFVVRCRWNQAKCIVGKRSPLGHPSKQDKTRQMPSPPIQSCEEDWSGDAGV